MNFWRSPPPTPERESLVSDISAGDGKIGNLFLQCIINLGNFLSRFQTKCLADLNFCLFFSNLAKSFFYW